jgi:hypothetical protein
MNRRDFLKGLTAISIGVAIPVQLVSTPIKKIDTTFAEQYRLTLAKLAEQRESRLLPRIRITHVKELNKEQELFGEI